MEESLITIEELADRLRVSTNSVRWHVKQGRIRQINIGRLVRFQFSQVIGDLTKAQPPRRQTGNRAVSKVSPPLSIFDNRVVSLVSPQKREEKHE